MFNGNYSWENIYICKCENLKQSTEIRLIFLCFTPIDSVIPHHRISQKNHSVNISVGWTESTIQTQKHILQLS